MIIKLLQRMIFGDKRMNELALIEPTELVTTNEPKEIYVSNRKKSNNRIYKHDYPRNPKWRDNPKYECLTLSNFVITATIESRYATGHTHQKDVGMYCPRCGSILNLPDHGECTDCPECNLHMIVYGNSVTVCEGGVFN